MHFVLQKNKFLFVSTLWTQNGKPETSSACVWCGATCASHSLERFARPYAGNLRKETYTCTTVHRWFSLLTASWMKTCAPTGMRRSSLHSKPSTLSGYSRLTMRWFLMVQRWCLFLGWYGFTITSRAESRARGVVHLRARLAAGEVGRLCPLVGDRVKSFRLTQVAARANRHTANENADRHTCARQVC